MGLISARFQECAAIEIAEGFAELLLRIHDNGAVPGYRFFERLPGNQQEADAIVSCLHGDFVSAVK
jgi:hypothetical protein